MRVAVALGALAVAVGGCGGGEDPDEVEAVVRDFYAASARSDGEAFCKLVTQEFRERITISQGDAARRECVDQIDRRQGSPLKVLDVTQTRIEGDVATVTVRLDVEGQTQFRNLRLVKEDGSFRLTEG